METENFQRQLSKARISSFTNQSVLILNQNSSSCAADKVDSLHDLVKRSPSAPTSSSREVPDHDVATMHGDITVDSRVIEMIERGGSQLIAYSALAGISPSTTLHHLQRRLAEIRTGIMLWVRTVQ